MLLFCSLPLFYLLINSSLSPVPLLAVCWLFSPVLSPLLLSIETPEHLLCLLSVFPDLISVCACITRFMFLSYNCSLTDLGLFPASLTLTVAYLDHLNSGLWKKWTFILPVRIAKYSSFCFRFWSLPLELWPRTDICSILHAVIVQSNSVKPILGNVLFSGSKSCENPYRDRSWCYKMLLSCLNAINEWITSLILCYIYKCSISSQEWKGKILKSTNSEQWLTRWFSYNKLSR